MQANMLPLSLLWSEQVRYLTQFTPNQPHSGIWRLRSCREALSLTQMIVTQITCAILYTMAKDEGFLLS